MREAPNPHNNPVIIAHFRNANFNMGFPGGSDRKVSACNAGDLGSILGLERSPGEGNGNPPQYSCLENSVDRGPVFLPGESNGQGSHGPQGCKELDTTEQLTLSF